MSHDGSDTATTVGTLHVDVSPLADAPVLMVSNAAGQEDAAIPLDISAHLTDVDGSETLGMTVIENVQQLFHQYRFDRVVNLAAQAGVRYSVENPDAYIQSNLLGFANLLEDCKNHQVGHLVFASSSSVYGANTRMPFSVHQNVDHPLSLYAATKKANELMAHSYAHLFALPATGLRFFTVYGPWGRPSRSILRNFCRV
ncbi:MAG: NAD-dependent epimerase/dehydratase family protein [Magnetococcales bacterium]|nr:NAD-dependent epimerase/dehydratase family protein [Magnetococcales bacterium]